MWERRTVALGHCVLTQYATSFRCQTPQTNRGTYISAESQAARHQAHFLWRCEWRRGRKGRRGRGQYKNPASATFCLSSDLWTRTAHICLPLNPLLFTQLVWLFVLRLCVSLRLSDWREANCRRPLDIWTPTSCCCCCCWVPQGPRRGRESALLKGTSATAAWEKRNFALNQLKSR